MAVCDCDAMGVAPKIIEDLLWPCEWAFGIDDPLELAERLQIASESGGFEELGEIPEEPQAAGIERCLEAFKEQPAVESGENVDWEEEIGTATNPASVGCETSTRNYEVSMWVMSQGLTPGVQNGDHPGRASTASATMACSPALNAKKTLREPASCSTSQLRNRSPRPPKTSLLPTPRRPSVHVHVAADPCSSSKFSRAVVPLDIFQRPQSGT
jgi:hypothetical protein